MGVGLVAKAPAEANGLGQRFLILHLVVTRPFHLAHQLDAGVVGHHPDDVLVLQRHRIVFALSHQVVVDVEGGDHLAAALDFNVAERADTRGAARQVEQIEGTGQRRYGVGAGAAHLAHHVDLDAAHLPQGDFGKGVGGPLTTAAQAGVHLGEAVNDGALGLIDGEAVHVDRPQVVERYGAVAVHFQRVALARGSPDVHRQLVAGAHLVVLGRGQVHARLEAEFFGVEEFKAEDLLFFFGDLVQRRVALRVLTGVLPGHHAAASVVRRPRGASARLPHPADAAHQLAHLGAGHAPDDGLRLDLLVGDALRLGPLEVLPDLGVAELIDPDLAQILLRQVHGLRYGSGSVGKSNHEE